MHGGKVGHQAPSMRNSTAVAYDDLSLTRSSTNDYASYGSLGRERAVEHVVGKFGGHMGPDEARMNGIDPSVVWRQFERCRFGQTGNRGARFTVIAR